VRYKQKGTTRFQCRVECWFRRVTVADGSTVTQDAVVDRIPDEKAAEGVAADQGKEIGSTTVVLQCLIREK
jgi:hypothetical protein